MIFKPLYYITFAWQILYITVSVIYVIYCSCKYTGHLSKQILLYVIGLIFPTLLQYITFIYYMLSDSKVKLPPYIFSLTYSITAILMTTAIFKYKFMDKIPISVKNIIEHIKESFLVVDYNNNVLEMNNSFKKNFRELLYVEKMNLFEIFNNNLLDKFSDKLNKNIYLAREKGQTIKFEHSFELNKKNILL